MIKYITVVLGVCVMLSPAYPLEMSVATKENYDALARYHRHTHHYSSRKYIRRGHHRILGSGGSTNGRVVVGVGELASKAGIPPFQGVGVYTPVPYSNVSGSMVVDMTGRSSYKLYDRSQADTCGGVYVTH